MILSLGTAQQSCKMSFVVTQARKNKNSHAHAGLRKSLTSAKYKRVDTEEHKVPVTSPIPDHEFLLRSHS